MKYVLFFISSFWIPLNLALADKWNLPPEGYQFEQISICPRLVPPNLIYDVCRDQMNAFQENLSKAKSVNKLLIVVIGATWCPWCTSLHKMLPSDQVLRYTRDTINYAEKFEMVEIATSTKGAGGDKLAIPSGKAVTEAILKPMGLAPKGTISGVPFLIIVDPANSARSILQQTDVLENNDNGPGHDPAKVRDALQKAYCELRSSEC